jgi:hypothetical protein
MITDKIYYQITNESLINYKLLLFAYMMSILWFNPASYLWNFYLSINITNIPTVIRMWNFNSICYYLQIYFGNIYRIFK